MLINLEKCFLSWKLVGKLGNIVSASKMFLNLLGNIFASRKANFVSAKLFPGVGKLGNMDSKQNVSATVFPSLPRALKLAPLKYMTPFETLGKKFYFLPSRAWCSTLFATTSPSLFTISSVTSLGTNSLTIAPSSSPLANQRLHGNV